MRIRYPFAAGFLILLLSSAYLGLAPLVIAPINDKILHFCSFFLLTLALYWALDLPRRLLLKIVFFAITVLLAVTSEVVQGALPNGRDFDFVDVAANVGGSAMALALCSWYHKRMLERKRRRKVHGYGVVPAGEGDDDVELGVSGSSDGMGRAEEDDGAEAWDEVGAAEENENEDGDGDVGMRHVDAIPVGPKD